MQPYLKIMDSSIKLVACKYRILDRKSTSTLGVFPEPVMNAGRLKGTRGRNEGKLAAGENLTKS